MDKVGDSPSANAVPDGGRGGYSGASRRPHPCCRGWLTCPARSRETTPDASIRSTNGLNNSCRRPRHVRVDDARLLRQPTCSKSDATMQRKFATVGRREADSDDGSPLWCIRIPRLDVNRVAAKPAAQPVQRLETSPSEVRVPVVVLCSFSSAGIGLSPARNTPVDAPWLQIRVRSTHTLVARRPRPE